MLETILTVLENRQLTDDVFALTLHAEKTEEIKCGQFINLKVPNRPDLLLKRPFGIVSFDKTKRKLGVCIQIRGEGTKELSMVEVGDKIEATFPLGNGFEIKESYKKIALVGGGIGVFPLLSVPTLYQNKKFYSFLGFRNKDNMYLLDEFQKVSEKTFVATDDGSFEYKGFCVDRLKSQIEKLNPDVVLACGPKGMFKSLKEVMKNHPNIPTFVSLEERMGCGIGACLVCTCKIKNENGEVKNKRVCADGPVFNLNEVDLDD